jgi:hypothetical protein
MTNTDDKNPDFVFQGTATELLVMAIRGEIDMNARAARELAARGLDKSGNWVGFDAAKKIHGVS